MGWWAAEFGFPVVAHACAVEAVDRCLQGLSIDTGRMAENLDRTKGRIMAESLTMALARDTGRPAAQAIVEELSRRAEATGASVMDVARADSRITAHLEPRDLRRILDPSSYLGSTDALITRALEAFQARRSSGARS